MDFTIFLGIAGLLLISAGVIIKSRLRQNICYVAGGVLLGIYSLILNDAVFITLQIVFVAAALYDLNKYKRKNSSS